MAVKKTNGSEPWKPAPYEEADTYAIKALAAGNASAGQQQRALNWVIYTLCGTYDQPYRPESDRDTIFACAKQFVGQQLVKQTMLNIPAKK